MAIFEWDGMYSVNNLELDKHHQKLFEILNKLYDLMANGADDVGIIRIIEELSHYSIYHFSEEEKMMERVGYPELNSHKQLHKEFISTIEGFQKDANNGKAIFVAVKAADIGMNWLKSHILIADGHYKSYLATQ